LSNYLEPVFLESIAIGQYFDKQELHRSLNDRILGLGNQLEIYEAAESFPYYKTAGKKYTPVSINWISSDPEVEYCIDGRKQGHSSKRVEGVLPLKSQSRLSKRRLYHLFQSDIPFNFEKYQNQKLSDEEYSKMRKQLFKTELFKAWLFTVPQSINVDKREQQIN
jgi:hypothetical protein